MKKLPIMLMVLTAAILVTAITHCASKEIMAHSGTSSK